VKLRPRPEADRLIVARFERLAEAGAAVHVIMGSDLIPSALELVDSDALRAAGLGEGDQPALLVGLDGPAAQVDWQQEELARLIGVRGDALDGPARDAAWKRLGELDRTCFDQPTAVMTWGVLPSQVAEVTEEARAAARRRRLRAAIAAHAGVGIVTAVLGEGDDPNVVVAALEDWRRLVAARGGHARIDWAPLAVKERVPVWDPPGPAHRIMKRLKDELDPRGILNPGRFVGGI
jgi:glycolate oxidase FAD binding subunit